MKRLIAIAVTVISAIVLCTAAYAESSSYTLTTDTVGKWEGVAISHIFNRSDYYCMSGTGSSTLTLDPGDADSVHICFDAGAYPNGVNTDVSAVFMSGDDVLAESNVRIALTGVFNRYEIGTEEMFAGLPEGTDKLVIKLENQQQSGKRMAYFRGFSVVFSNSAAADRTGTALDFKVSGDIGNVEVETTGTDTLIMVGFVCAVALIMMISVKIRDKYRKGKR